jgi:hypothetical protein
MKNNLDPILIQNMHSVILEQKNEPIEDEVFLRKLYYSWQSKTTRTPMFFFVHAFDVFKRFDDTLKARDTIDYLALKYRELHKDYLFFDDLDILCAKGYLHASD